MYTTIVHWYPLAGKHDEAMTALSQLAETVKANEPDTWMYLVHASARGGFPPAPEGTIVFIEGYKDFKAFMAHVNGPAFQDFVKQHGQLFQQVSPPNTGIFFLTDPLKRFAGFIRAQAE